MSQLRHPATPKRTLAQVDADLAPLLEERNSIRDAERYRESLALLGRCFKYRNCYSLPHVESDYWWLYAKVIEIKDFAPVTFRFQTDRDGKMEVEPEARFFNSSSYVEIKLKEFNAAWRKAQRLIQEMKP